ncbi:NAD-dependent epimerase/dehydratase family protein [Caproicibacter fermentans]|uniref:Sugar nucleotide-binding protein n=1 Tax=Caproicibacter fermentans TaxID=2576756 RepID=A0A7G8TFN4_9FIRM|nr:sugar nucleotide-binding protein [Caproicibacter fermentans]QNK42425.1 sugar nucleotide-binding protein [Caproicibacter fermentans]
MYVIIGANGFLGSYLIKNILQISKDCILATTRNMQNVKQYPRVQWITCDVTDSNSVSNLKREIEKHEPCKIIYLAAYHHPDMVEKNPKIAWNCNITALSSFLNTIENVKCFFYPSTDSVCGNSEGKKHFRECDALKPVNLYGKQKAAAECLVTTYGYNVIRYPFLIGPSLSPNKKHFYDTIVEALQENRPFEMFQDSYRSSLDFDTAAELLIQLVENYNDSMPKILNLSGDDDLSKYDIGLMIAKRLGVSTNLIVPISIQKQNGIFKAERAQSTLLDNTLIKKALGMSSIKINL